MNAKEQEKTNTKNGTQGIPQEQRRHKLAKSHTKVGRRNIGFKGSVPFAADTISAEGTNLPNERNKLNNGPREVHFSNPYSTSKIVHPRLAGEFETSI